MHYDRNDTNLVMLSLQVIIVYSRISLILTKKLV